VDDSTSFPAGAAEIGDPSDGASNGAAIASPLLFLIAAKGITDWTY
jgi:hypothetical protein